MPLKVIDKTGRLPKNPKDWPAELKRAIAECCCGDDSSSSSSSSSPKIYGLDCCLPSDKFSNFCLTVGNGSAYDGTYHMTYQEQQHIWHTVTPSNFGVPTCFTVFDEYVDGWFSDWVTDCRGTCAVMFDGRSSPVYRHRVFLRKNMISGKASCTVEFVNESKYWSIAGGPCDGEIQLNAGVLFSYQLDMVSIDCDPLIIIYQNSIPNCGCDTRLGGDGFPVPVDAILTECN